MKLLAYKNIVPVFWPTLYIQYICFMFALSCKHPNTTVLLRRRRLLVIFIIKCV